MDDKQKRSLKEGLEVSNGSNRSYPVKGGCLHFLKFDTRKINECLDFIDSNQLHGGGNYWRSFSEDASKNNAVIKATGGGAYMYTNLFKERLGVNLDKEDEMDSLVAGANFLLKIAYLNAKIYGLKRIFFGGYFIRGHACIMDTISYAIDFRSNGEEKLCFCGMTDF